MSEDVKPRKLTLERYGHAGYGNKVTKAYYRVYKYVDELMPENKLPRAETINVIELEPTMRLMDDMAKILEFCSFDNLSRRESQFEAKSILEKYKKFKDGLK